MPFEIKSIYGLEHKEEGDADTSMKVEGLPFKQEDDDESKDCLVCLCEPKNTIIMPCGHMCVCHPCGQQLQGRNHLCPVCRGKIGSLVPLDLAKINK